VLKLARTGSTWLSTELGKTALYCGVRPELLNALGGLNSQQQCSKAVTLLKEQFQCHPGQCSRCDIAAPFAAATLSLIKNGGYQTREGSLGECWSTTLVNEISHLQPAPVVISLTRANVVAQAASLLKSQSSACATPYHLENCPGLKDVKISPEPSELLALATRLQEQSQLQRREAENIVAATHRKGESAIHMSFEQMVAAGGIPPSLLRRISPLDADGTVVNISYAAATNGGGGGDSGGGGGSKIQPTLANFEACVEYFRTSAPQAMLEMLLEGVSPPLPPPPAEPIPSPTSFVRPPSPAPPFPPPPPKINPPPSPLRRSPSSQHPPPPSPSPPPPLPQLPLPHVPPFVAAPLQPSANHAVVVQAAQRGARAEAADRGWYVSTSAVALVSLLFFMPLSIYIGRKLALARRSRVMSASHGQGLKTASRQKKRRHLSGGMHAAHEVQALHEGQQELSNYPERASWGEDPSI